MAVVLAYRVAIALIPGGVAILRWASGPGVGSADRVSGQLRDRISGGAESDEDLSAALSDEVGTLAEVATYPDPFELRQFQVIFSRTSGNVEGDDVALFTFHCLKLVGGAPSEEWAAADFTAVQGAVDTMWNSIKNWYPVGVAFKRLKAYKAGPAISPPQVAVYDLESAGVPGASGASSALPPQVALTVTERAGSKLHWGRLYLPAPNTSGATGGNATTANGRPSSNLLTAVADAFDVMYETLRTANLPVVVYRGPLPAREIASGATLPARTASAWTVDTIAVDDVYDVMRSRRWKTPTVRVLRGIGA